MKKSKQLSAGLAAAIFAISSGALVACSDIDLPEELADVVGLEVEFNANGGMFAGNKESIKIKTDLAGNVIEGNSELFTVTLKSGKLVVKFDEPKRSDYAFDGYSLKQDGTSKVTYTASGCEFRPSSTPKVVYAQWKSTVEQPPAAIVVTFDANGGKFADDATTMDVTAGTDGRIAERPTPPTLANNTFAGFFLEKEAAGTTLIDYGATGYQFTASTKVYAHWTASSTPEPGPVDPNPPSHMTDPNPPARVHMSAKINDEAMTDKTTVIDRGPNADGNGYKNHTLIEQFEAVLTVTEVTEYSFTVGADNVAVSSIWVEHAKAISVKIGNTLVPDNEAETGDKGGRSDNGKFKLAAGTYTLYLKNYGENNWVVWIEGTQTGEFVNEETVGDFYIVGSMNDYECKEQFKLNGANGACVVSVQKDADFKLARKSTDNSTDYSIQYKYSDVTVGAEMVDEASTDNKIKFKEGGSYIIKLNSEWKIEITRNVAIKLKINDGNPVSISQSEKGTDSCWDQHSITKTLSAGDIVRFVVGANVIENVYAQGQVEDCSCVSTHVCKIALGNIGKRASSFRAAADGSYVFHLKYYGEFTNNDKGYVLYVITPESTTDPDFPSRAFEGKVLKLGENSLVDDTSSVDRGPEGNSYKNKMLSDRFHTETDVTISANTEMKLTIAETSDGDPTEIQGIWVTAAEGVSVKVGENIASKNVGQRGNSIILGAGTYSFTLSYYTDGGEDHQGGWVLSIEGSGNYAVVDANRNPPARQHDGKIIKFGSDIEMTDCTQYIDRGPEGNSYKNNKLSDRFIKQQVHFDANTEIEFSFKDIENPAIQNIWVETKTDVSVKVGGKIVSGSGDKGARGNSVILSAGTYDFTLSYYTDGGENHLGGWGLFIDGSGTYAPPVEVKNGSTAVAIKRAPVTEPDTARWLYVLDGQNKLQLDKGAELSFLVDGVAPTKLVVRPGSHGIAANNETKKVTVKAAGEFTFTLRYFDAKGSNEACWQVEMSDGKRGTVTENNLYVVGLDNEWSCEQKYELSAEKSITLTLNANDEFKIATCKNALGEINAYNYGADSLTATSGQYAESGNNGNIKIKTAGEYIITVTNDGKINIEEVDNQLNVGHYYVVFSSDNWRCVARNYIGENAGSVKLAIPANAEFKVAKCKDNTGVSDLESNSHGTADIKETLTGLFYADSNNIKIRYNGTYTVTLADGKISIAKEAVYKTVTLVFSDISFTIKFERPYFADDTDTYIYAFNSNDKPCGEFPGKAMSGQTITLKVNDIAVSSAGYSIIITFKQGVNINKQTHNIEVSGNFLDGKTYLIELATGNNVWSGNNFIHKSTDVTPSAEQQPAE